MDRLRMEIMNDIRKELQKIKLDIIDGVCDVVFVI